MILTEDFLEIPVKNYIVGMLLTCPISNSINISITVYKTKQMFLP